MAKRKQCSICKQNRRFSDYNPSHSIVCKNCDKRHVAPPKKQVRHFTRIKHVKPQPAITTPLNATLGGVVISPSAPPIPPAITTRIKTCQACSLEKTWHQFFRDTNSPDGLGNICKNCLGGEFIVPTVTKTTAGATVNAPVAASPIVEERDLKCYRCSKQSGHDVFYKESLFYLHSNNGARGRQSFCIKCMKELDRQRRTKDKTPAETPPAQVAEVVPETLPAAQSLLLVPETRSSLEVQEVRVETRHVTMVPAFARAGNMILNLSNVAFMDDTDPNKIEVVLNIHDIGRDGVQHPRAFVVCDNDAYALRTALQTIMANDEQIQQMARLIKRVEDAARNEATALELASSTERQVASVKARLDTKDQEIEDLKRQLSEEIGARLNAEEKAGDAYSKLAAINAALGR